MNNDHLDARNKLIADLATLAREMLNHVDCNDWKWTDYKNRLKSIATGNSEKEEKNRRMKSILITLWIIIGIFAALICFFFAGFLWLCTIRDLFYYFDNRIVISQFITTLLGACIFTTPLIYIVIKGDNET